MGSECRFAEGLIEMVATGEAVKIADDRVLELSRTLRWLQASGSYQARRISQLY
ncbi:MAG: hypothetical protein N0C81_20450 [Candidatus Thiodiazotropha lotti]|uniref:Uncharacterized protein n=1 Tax=Candidatus Thiodiazotropha lotti TaxID=2792787 RepID=A0A9E4K9G3_9GAMM|nr:hypothetical protein [Candidatus Thiodiazotropha lotti]MCG7930741.1 hypothetical protein [Candidatus Thiodiazotropha lotti]MCG7941325.1 hypothetical protein [Candidatus Thiodiazotropha lotti]MCG7987181.1 hypothetical protein [Candidatus Thiodiazotropha lotti]MCG8003545.1 hypothetical protein [Candidatus Thiodiazotropha lotti]